MDPFQLNFSDQGGGPNFASRGPGPGPLEAEGRLLDLVSRDVFRWIRNETNIKTEVSGSILDVYVSENSLG